jgi:hypothetical protein
MHLGDYIPFISTYAPFNVNVFFRLLLKTPLLLAEIQFGSRVHMLLLTEMCFLYAPGS